MLLASIIDSAMEAVDGVSTSVEDTYSQAITDYFHKSIDSLIYVSVALLVVKLIAMSVYRGVKEKMSPQGAVFLTRWIWRIGVAMIVVGVLKQWGFDLVTVLGAAGIAGVAVGFASQNSLSNVISGLFLMGERSINLNDFIEIDGVKGSVENIGLLSVTLRTLDNKQVRVPNETLLKGVMINITRYPIRRFDLPVGVSYNEDLDKVVRVLKMALNKNTLCLNEPEPLVVFTGFGNSSCDFLVGAWCRRQDYDELRTSLSRGIKEAFDAEGIEIPFPYTVLSGGKAAAPIQVKVMGESEEKNGL